MKVLVTGGAGYIGSVVVEQLVQHGHEAWVYDNLSLGHRAAIVPQAHFVLGDLAERDKLGRTLVENQIEAVIHMAASSVIGVSVTDPHAYYQNNFVNGVTLLDAMLSAGVKRLVYSSTAAVYGLPEKIPITETTPTNPINPYGEAKLAFERALRWYDNAYGLRYASLRYFNAAGATEHCGEDHDPESHIIPLILRVAAGQADHVKIFGEDYPTPDKTCIRDYVHVIDLAEAHILALTAIEKESCILNLGYGNGYSVAEVVEMARQVTGVNIKTESAQRRPGDPPVLIASADQAMLNLGWQPRHSELDNIIGTAWRWHQAHPNGYEVSG
jgi:UDP-glucose 4-epimerase